MVSIILPNYNYEHFLPQRIESILGQSYTDFELIILDDCSPDNSLEIIARYKIKDSRIKVFTNTNNSGSPFVQWDKGIKLAKGEYIWIAEADDYCEPTLLEKLITKLKATHSDVCFAETQIVDAEGAFKGLWADLKIGEDKRPVFKTDFEMIGHRFIENHLVYQNDIPNASAVLFKKEMYNQIGGVNLNVPNCADWLLWIQMLKNGKLAFVSKPLNYFRRHENSVIHTIKKKEASSPKFYEYYSLTMRLVLRNHLPVLNENKSIHKVNNDYIIKDLTRRIKWAKSLGNYTSALNDTLLLFKVSGNNPKYLLSFLK